MHELNLKIDDKAFARLKSEMGIKRMCGNAYGVPDELTFLIIRAIIANERALVVELKPDNTSSKCP